MKILVTGASGQLGYDVMKELKRRNIECVGVSSQQFDITDFEAADKFITNYKPEAIIHCAAYTAVDKAENEGADCWKVNVLGTENIAKICQKIAAKLLYISTDYVFPGVGDDFYETEDKTKPVNFYGLTKLEGEQIVRALLTKYFIVRISWVFGCHGSNFVKTILKLGEAHAELNIVADQIGSPTYTVDAGKILCDMISTDKYGVYHVTNEGSCSWADFAREILAQAGKNVEINNISTRDYPTRAARPLNSRLSKSKLLQNGFAKLPSWQNALTRYLQELELR